MGQNQETRDHVNRMHDDRFAKIAKYGKSNTWMASRTLLRRLDVNIAGEQASWIKCRT